MAEHKYKSQADKAAAEKKKKKKPAAKKEQKAGKVTVNSVPEARKIPVRVITSAVFLGVFVLFLVIFFKPEGALVKLLENIIHGLIGRVGFLVAIPGLLYLFIIHAFSGKRPVRMRTICISAFVLLCGCIAHLSLNANEFNSGLQVVEELYSGGIDGTSGGVICGGLTMLLHWLCGTAISYIILILAAIFTLLGGMQITVISIIRAIQDRPRPNWEETPEERPEPAAIVVNHIANKRIEHLEHQREARSQKQAMQQEPKKATVVKNSEPEKVADMFRQIDDTETPVSAASEYVSAPVQEEEPPSKMPPLELENAVKEEPAPPVQKVKPEKVTVKEAKSSAQAVAKEIEEAQKEAKPEYCFPPIDLLKLPSGGMTDGTMEMRENSRRLNETLASFKIEAHIINVTRGPSVTRYEVELEKGNIAKLPHMLIAGTTGSGKSVCMNSIIISLLYKASPNDVKLIMVDPKMVELGIYNGIPHLLIPVVTDPKKAAGSLQWAVSEMMRRYKAMSDAGVRDLESYNSIMENQAEDNKKLPQVVVIIDELADLMLVAAKEVEESICRIAQMGRAAGIHLVIATQRPSADVITGLMKANIPSRIAFSVASAMESRIILDTQGAEKLVGRGDMLFAPIGNGKPKRVQGCFVSDPEVEAVATYVKANFVTNYDQEVMEEIERKASQTGNKGSVSEPEANADELGGDEMLPAAVDVILETGQASVSMLQRRLKLGYARAARIVDEMEEKGIVGPFQGSKPRDILITKEQWILMRSGGNEQMGFDDMNEYDSAEDTAVPEDF